MLKKFILISVILCSLELYTLVFLPDMVIEVVEMAGIAIIVFFLLLYTIYGEEQHGKKRFALPVWLILIAVIFSMIGAYVFQEQSFTTSAVGQRVIYYYLIYFLLHYLRIPLDYIRKLIVVFAMVPARLDNLPILLHPMQMRTSQNHMGHDSTCPNLLE